MTREEALKFEGLFNHWASTDVQMDTKNGEYEDGKQHIFIAVLLQKRQEIIDAVKATSPEVRV